MRVLVRLLFTAVVLATQAALADSRVFIIANQSDGYGIDQCLANGDKCGAPMAKAYCQQRNFADASEFRRLDPDEITGAVPEINDRKCKGFGCAEYVAIICKR